MHNFFKGDQIKLKLKLSCFGGSAANFKQSLSNMPCNSANFSKIDNYLTKEFISTKTTKPRNPAHFFWTTHGVDFLTIDPRQSSELLYETPATISTRPLDLSWLRLNRIYCSNYSKWINKLFHKIFV